MRKDERITVIEICRILENVTSKLMGNINEDIINECVSLLDGARTVLLLNEQIIPSNNNA